MAKFRLLKDEQIAEQPFVARTKSSPAQKKKVTDDPTFLQDLIRLLFKVAIIGLCIVLLFTFIFGAFRYSDTSMAPAVKDGDMVITYRWDKDYKANDLVVFWYEGDPCIGRVCATEGQDVDIDGSGLKVDGYGVLDMGKGQETTQVLDGVTFPLTVPERSVFVLGDSRKVAIDSRTFGCVEIDQTEGKVIGLFRNRGL